MGITVQFDTAAVGKRCKARLDRAQAVLDIQVLKDSNYYCPVAEGTLRDSGAVSSGGGEVAWETPYASDQYNFFENKRKDKNPNASTKWFERAKSTKAKAWEALANREYKKG